MVLPMLDTGVRVAASFVPAGVPVIIGLVLAVMRRRVEPRVARLAIIGLALHLVVVLLSTGVVALLPALVGSGWSVASIQQLSSVIGLVTVLVTLLAWTVLLLALFTRLPASAAAPEGRTGPGRPVDMDAVDSPTGRHVLLDARGAPVIAEEGVSLYPAAAAAINSGAFAAAPGPPGRSTSAAAPTSRRGPATPVPVTPSLPVGTTRTR
jgi:hypothetical protein